MSEPQVPVPGRRPTIRDIARMANVSAGAVSLALNNKPGVSDETRSRIVDLAASLGWTPSIAAKALSNSKASAIGLVLARPRASVAAERFYFQFICGVESVLTGHGQALVLQMVDDICEELDVHRAWWAEGRVDSVILVDPRRDDPRPARLSRLGLPFVSVGTHLEGGGAVLIDDVSMVTCAVDHLAARGHRVIGYVSGYDDLQHTNRRQRAMAERAEEVGVALRLSKPTDFSEDSGSAETERLLGTGVRPDAFIFDNEILTLGGLAAIGRAGLHIPQDVAVLSLEDSPVNRVIIPQISAFLRDPGLLGAAAARLLIDSAGDVSDRVEQVPTPSLAVRASSAPTVTSL